MRSLYIALSSLFLLAACVESPTAPTKSMPAAKVVTVAKPSYTLDPSPTLSAWQVWNLGFYSACTGLLLEGTVDVHLIGRWVVTGPESSFAKNRMNIAGGRVHDYLGRQYVIQEIVSGSQVVPTWSEGTANYEYNIRIIPIRDSDGVAETSKLVIIIRWTLIGFEVTTDVTSSCK